jgi:AraC-like DNA-binding protein
MASSLIKTQPMSCRKPTSEFDTTLTQRAVLLPQHVGQRFRINRYPVGEALAPWAEFHWIVEWDLLDNDLHTQRVMPYPNANLAFEAGQTAIHGPSRGLFTRQLRGRGRVHGVRFKCGGLRPWIDCSMSTLSDTQVSPLYCLPHSADITEVEENILNLKDHRDAVAYVERLLSTQIPSIDPLVERLDNAVQAVQRDSSITRVPALQELLDLDERALQRCFSNYLGVTPKWLIQRARIHDALQSLAVDAETPLAHLALRLGFFDQAHFNRCFRQHTGQSPQQYRQALHVMHGA